MTPDEPFVEGLEDSHLKDSIESLRALALGIVSKVASSEDAEVDAGAKPVVSPEVDAAMERLGQALGEVLEGAGKALKEQSNRANFVAETLRADPQSAISHGAEALGAGLQALARELQGHLEKPEEEP